MIGIPTASLIHIVWLYLLPFPSAAVVEPGDIRLKDGQDSDDECPFDDEELRHILGAEELVLRRTPAPEAILDDHRFFDVSLQGSVRLHRHPVAKIFEDLVSRHPMLLVPLCYLSVFTTMQIPERQVELLVFRLILSHSLKLHLAV